MARTINNNGTIGATVCGHIFTTYDGVEAYYLKLQRAFVKKPSYESAFAPDIFAAEMVDKLGYTWEQIESLDNEVYKAA